jgi:Ni/Co efflux regulator RcnB
MKKLLLTTAAVGLFATASIAVAQEDQHGDKKPEQAAKPANAQDHAGKAPVQRGAPPVAARPERPAVTAGAPPSGPSAQRATAVSAQRATAVSGEKAGTETAHRTSNVAALQRNVQASNRYHAAAYQPPAGYADRQWRYGQRLPASYYASNYWIADYVMYALFAPPPGLIWVRVGNDALLVDQNTGDVVQVQYGVFY